MSFDAVASWVCIIAGVALSVVGIRLAYRRVGLAGTYVYLGGLLLLAASAFRVYPAPDKPGQPQDIEKLQIELVQEKGRSALARQMLNDATTRIVNLERSVGFAANDLSSAKSTISVCATDKEKEFSAKNVLQTRIDKDGLELDSLRNTLALAKDEIKGLNQKLDSERATLRSTVEALQIQKKLVGANVSHLRLVESSRAALADQLAAKEQQLAAFPKMPAQPAAQAANNRSSEPPRQVAKVNLQLDGTAKVGVEKLNDRELVQGEIGEYYIISLKDTATGNPITFPQAQFAITDKPSELHGAIRELRDAVLRRVPQGWRYRIFVRGHADGGSFKEPVSEEYYRNLEYLPPSGAAGSSYLRKPVRKRLNREFENEDLPNLRGAFLAKMLQEDINGAAPTLLGNMPRPGTDKANRRAEIILFLAGPDGGNPGD
jgi:hypothetical protein